MPYIEGPQRKQLDPYLKALSRQVGTSGELAYTITRLCSDYVENHGLRYSTLAAMTGILETVKLEFNRRLVAPYEAEKCSQNGDVY